MYIQVEQGIVPRSTFDPISMMLIDKHDEAEVSATLQSSEQVWKFIFL
jgi:hypothetical protein